MALPVSAGGILLASDVNTLYNLLGATSVTNTDATSRTTSSITYTTTLSPANICGTAFTAPPSGKIVIHWSSQLSNSSGPNVAECSPAVRTGSTVGSGTSVHAAAVTNAITAIANTQAGSSVLVTGLTAGSSYNVALEHRAFSAGTATFANRVVTVVPISA
jgi:hypothetical protein